MMRFMKFSLEIVENSLLSLFWGLGEALLQSAESQTSVPVCLQFCYCGAVQLLLESQDYHD